MPILLHHAGMPAPNLGMRMPLQPFRGAKHHLRRVIPRGISHIARIQVPEKLLRSQAAACADLMQPYRTAQRLRQRPDQVGQHRDGRVHAGGTQQQLLRRPEWMVQQRSRRPLTTDDLGQRRMVRQQHVGHLPQRMVASRLPR